MPEDLQKVNGSNVSATRSLNNFLGKSPSLAQSKAVFRASNRLFRAMSSGFLRMLKDGDGTASPDDAFQCMMTLSVKFPFQNNKKLLHWPPPQNKSETKLSFQTGSICCSYKSI